jgi:hypothetical protein
MFLLETIDSTLCERLWFNFFSLSCVCSSSSIEMLNGNRRIFVFFVGWAMEDWPSRPSDVHVGIVLNPNLNLATISIEANKSSLDDKSSINTHSYKSKTKKRKYF